MENFFFKNPSHFGDMFGLFEEFYRSNSMADVVIAVDGKTIKAHRIVLSAGSDYFRRILVSINSTSHVPILFITDISYEDMESIIEFIYRGQILVTRDKVESLRQAAYKLRIKGFENFLRKPFNSSGIGMGNNGHHQPQQQQIKYNPSSSIPRNLSMLNVSSRLFKFTCNLFVNLFLLLLTFSKNICSNNSSNLISDQCKRVILRISEFEVTMPAWMLLALEKHSCSCTAIDSKLSPTQMAILIRELSATLLPRRCSESRLKIL